MPLRLVADRQEAQPTAQERFVGFAFAAADLMVEIEADRCIRFAAGIFRERLGCPPEAFSGCPVASLVAPEDGMALEIALSLLRSRGRLAPVTLRLADAARTPMALAGLALPDRRGRAWLTFTRLPMAAPPAEAMAAEPLFQQAVAARLRSDAGGCVALVEIGGWGARRGTAADRQELQAGIAAALREAGGEGAMTAEMEDGRFGILGPADLDLADTQGRIAAWIATHEPRHKVTCTGIPVEVIDGDVAASVRAMRFALRRFSAAGHAGLLEAELQDGLGGFLRRAESSARGLDAAIEAGRFRLVFQPVASLADRAVHHFEALIRPFPVPGETLANPQEFVALAEATGCAERLDEAVLARVAEALRGSRALVAVNLSGLSVQSPNFRDELATLLAREPACRERLLVELTETAAIEDTQAAIETVEMLVGFGVPVCLDDFGAGFAAFRYLRDFRVDYVKIDGSYVQKAGSAARDSGFIGAMVELARSVGARAIAEMIETEAQAEQMRSHGVELGQGWLFGRPGALPGSL